MRFIQIKLLLWKNAVLIKRKPVSFIFLFFKQYRFFPNKVMSYELFLKKAT